MATFPEDAKAKPRKPLATYGKSKRPGFSAAMKNDELADWDEFSTRPTTTAAQTKSPAGTKQTTTLAAQSQSPSPSSSEKASGTAASKKTAPAATRKPRAPRKATTTAPKKTTASKAAAEQKKPVAEANKPVESTSEEKEAKDIFDVPDYSDEELPKLRRKAAAPKKTIVTKATTAKTTTKSKATKTTTTTAARSKSKAEPTSSKVGNKTARGAKSPVDTEATLSGPNKTSDKPSTEAGESTSDLKDESNHASPEHEQLDVETPGDLNAQGSTSPSESQPAAGSPLESGDAPVQSKVASKAHEAKKVEAKPRVQVPKSSSLPVAQPGKDTQKEGKKRAPVATATAASKPASKTRWVGKRVEQLKEKDKEELEPDPEKASKRRSPTVEEQEIASRPKLAAKSRKSSPPQPDSAISNQSETKPVRNLLSPKSRKASPGVASSQETAEALCSPEEIPQSPSKNEKRLAGGMRQSLANLIDELEEEPQDPPKKKKKMLEMLQANPNSKRHSSSSEENRPPKKASQVPYKSPCRPMGREIKKNVQKTSPPLAPVVKPQFSLLDSADQFIPIRKTGVVATYGRQRSYREEEDDGRDPFLVSLMPQPRKEAEEEEEEEDTLTKLKSAFQLREAGSNKRFLDEMEDFIADVHSNDVRRKRSGLMELARKVNDKTFVRRFAANNFDEKLFSNIKEDDDVISSFCTAYMLLVFMGQDSTGRILQQLIQNGSIPMLQKMLALPQDICALAKDKIFKFSKLTQSLLSDIRQEVIINSYFVDYKAKIISPRLVALKLIDEFVGKMREAGIYKDVLPDSELSRMTQIMKPFAESKKAPAASDLVFLELAASIMERYLVFNRKPLTKQFSAEEIGILVNLFGSIMLWNSDSPDYASRLRDVQSTVLRLTINFVTENYDASTLFVGSEGIVQILVTIVVQKFDSLSSIADEDLDVEVDNLIMCMAMLQNFAKITYNIVEVIEETRVGDKTAIEALADLFVDRSTKMAEASTQRESLENVPVGHLSVALAYWCRDRNLRAVIRERTGNGSLKSLTATLEQFYTANQAVNDNSRGAGENFLEELERLVTDMQVLN